MKRNNLSKFFSFLVLVVISVFYLNCSGPASFRTDSNNEGSLDGGTTAGNPTRTMFYIAGTTSNLSIDLCIQSFDLIDTSFQTISFPDPKLLNIPPVGVVASYQNVPDNTYGALNILTDDICGAGYSIRVTNTNGTFAISRATRVQSLGATTTPGPTDQLALNLVNIVQRLVLATSSNDVQNAFDNYDGQLSAK